MRRFQLPHFLYRLPRGLWPGCLCALLVAGFSQLNWLAGPENGALDLMFQSRGPRAPDPRISILVADDAAVARVGQWPLPRSVYAKVIERLTAEGAHTIACDILFSVKSYSAAEDATLIKACKASGRVVQNAAFHVPLNYNPTVPVTLTGDRRVLPLRFAVTDEGTDCLAATWASSALPALQASAVAIGHVNIHPEIDGTLRHIPHLIRYREHVFPSLALAATAHFLGLKPRDIIATDQSVSLTGKDGVVHSVPVDENGESWINWAGGNDTFPTYSFNQLFDGQVPPEALKGRLILVGTTAAGAFEHRSTPFSPVQPAIELQANAISNLLTNQPLHEIPNTWQLGLLLGISTLLGMVVAPRRAVGATLCLLFTFAALWEVGLWFFSRGVYIPLATPALSSLLTYTMVIASSYRREWESNWRTDSSVAALARGGALMASSRQREKLLEVIHRTACEVLQAREVFLMIEVGDSTPEMFRETVLYPDYGHHLPTLTNAARDIAAHDRVILWATKGANPVLGSKNKARFAIAGSSSHANLVPESPPSPLREMLEKLSREVFSIHHRGQTTARRDFETILAAPLSRELGQDNGISNASPQVTGMLMAVGRRDALSFTERDAVLLQTISEQASLALDNLGYFEILQSRVELANRNLRDAYDVLSIERGMLFEERVKLAAAIESMESALVILDENDNVVLDNGIGIGELWTVPPRMGQSARGMLEVNDLAEVAALFDQIKLSENGAPHKATVETFRMVQRVPDQATERAILLAQLTPLMADDGSRLGSMLVLTDVTTERELEQMKSDFVSFVAHELRTPLTSINGFASLLKLPSLHRSEEQQFEMLSTIETQCSRLNRMISDLLEVARLEPGHAIDLRPAELNLVALCKKVLGQLRVLITDSHTLSLQMRCETDELWMNLDADRMEQVLINLLSNAIKYSPDGGVVTLDLSESDHEENVILKVTDTGMGMTPEQVSHMFQKYYRATDAQARGIKGTGLGLYLVKQLVEAHEGRIAVSSVTGQGTTFTVTLPKPIDY